MQNLVAEISYKGLMKSALKTKLESVINGDVHIKTDTYNAIVMVARNGRVIFKYPLYGFSLALRHRAITESYIDSKVKDIAEAYVLTMLHKYIK